MSAETLLHELERHFVLLFARRCNAIGGDKKIDIADMNLAGRRQNACIHPYKYGKRDAI